MWQLVLQIQLRKNITKGYTGSYLEEIPLKLYMSQTASHSIVGIRLFLLQICCKYCELGSKSTQSMAILTVYQVQQSHPITCLFSKYFQILNIFVHIFKYSQIYIRQTLLGPLKSDHFGQVVILKSTFIKQPQTKPDHCWQVFSFHSHCECAGAILEEYTYIKKAVMQVSNQIFFNAMFLFRKTKGKLVMT